jgi:flagellar biosynthesis protein FlhG
MYDQANELRQLVRHEAHAAASRTGRRPLLVTATGGKGGVGTTTIAVNLAVALAQQGRRTTLIDADSSGGASLLCRLKERDTLAEVLSARRTVREVLQPGPGGILVLPGAWGTSRPPDDSPAARQRLLDGLRGLESQADVIVADAGSGLGPVVQSLWQAADAVLMVTTPELPAVMGTYGSIKALSTESLLVPIHLLVNAAPDPATAEAVHDRIALACLRFLAVPVARAGHVSSDPQAAAAGGAGSVFVTAAPGCRAAQQVQALAAYVMALSSAGLRPVRPPMSRRIAGDGTQSGFRVQGSGEKCRSSPEPQVAILRTLDPGP